MAYAHKFSVRKSKIMGLGRIKNRRQKRREKEICSLWPYA